MSNDTQTMSVQVREGRLRAAPTFLGRSLAVVHYGDRVTVLERKGAWVRAATPGGGPAGWIHRSALTEKRIVFQAGAQDVGQAATTDELALAGKGFNHRVEERYRAAHPGLDFSWVDRMETYGASAEEVRRFLEEGGLSPEQGGL